MATLTNEQLRRLARLGAVARLEQLRQEEAAIRAEFPELFGCGRQARGTGAASAAGARTTKRAAGRRRRMSAANRKAVSERMRKYWAERRKAKAAK